MALKPKLISKTLRIFRTETDLYRVMNKEYPRMTTYIDLMVERCADRDSEAPARLR